MNQGLGNVDLDFEMIQKRSFNAEKSILFFYFDFYRKSVFGI